MEISAQHILEAHERIKPFIHKTPVLTSKTINKFTGAEIFFKCENFQRVARRLVAVRGGCRCSRRRSRRRGEEFRKPLAARPSAGWRS